MTHPFLADDYHIRWSTLTSENIEPDVNQALKLASDRLDAIRALSSDDVTYENTYAALETATEELSISPQDCHSFSASSNSSLSKRSIL